VTVVFTDVAGFTPLTERVDPERLRRVMSRYFATMQAVIERHGGTVEKFIGDAIMAVFGIPRLHEDDALRAVRAAVEMREALVALNRDLEVEWGIVLQVRTGINTGEVATGEFGSGDALVLGDAVNLAARLEQASAAQEILLGAATHRLVHGAVQVEELAPMTLKGKSGTVSAFRLVGLVSGFTPGSRRLDTRLVGRDDELARLRTLFEQVVAERTCHLVTAVGAAGVGKTRLVAEFVRAVESDAVVLQGQCPSYGEGITFWPVADVVRHAANVVAGDSKAEAGAKLAALVAGDADADAVVEQAGQLLGLTDETVGSEEIFWAVRKLLEKVARDRPLVVVFEDIHWAQPTFLDFVEYLVDWARDVPILVCCPARPELLDQHPRWCEGRPNVSRIELDPLSESDSTSLVQNLLQQDRLAERTRAKIVATAQGNPLYLEEMMSMLVDDGLLHREDGRWVLSGDLHDVRLPLTLQSVVATRLERLEPAERNVIEVAAVMGTTFSRRALFELIPDQPTASIRDRVRGLVDKDFLGVGPTGTQEGTLVFHHALTREAAYNAMSKETRAELHERFAEWLQATPPEGRLGGFEEVLGYHLEHAHLLGKELRPVDDHGRDLARRGSEQLAVAGRRAFTRADIVAAENLLSRALALLDAGDPDRLASSTGWRSTTPTCARSASTAWPRSDPWPSPSTTCWSAPADRVGERDDPRLTDPPLTDGGGFEAAGSVALSRRHHERSDGMATPRGLPGHRPRGLLPRRRGARRRRQGGLRAVPRAPGLPRLGPVHPGEARRVGRMRRARPAPHPPPEPPVGLSLARYRSTSDGDAGGDRGVERRPGGGHRGTGPARRARRGGHGRGLRRQRRPGPDRRLHRGPPHEGRDGRGDDRARPGHARRRRGSAARRWTAGPPGRHLRHGR